ncbi:MAG: phage holin family protein [Phaeodactylibacter sp.]|nr:phage holin family protein [Phaeodactylibacter sp.]MCB9292630.1 phage holin family protein [Lewinellaceae bacterium]
MKLPDGLMESSGEAYGYVKAYVEQQIEYTKLDIAERLSTSVSSAITAIVVLQLVFFAIGFLSLALGIYLGERRGSYVEGFLLVGGLYTLFTVAVILLRRPLITNPVVSRIIKIFFEVK